MFACKSRYENVNDDWLIKNLIETMWGNCTKRCGNTFFFIFKLFFVCNFLCLLSVKKQNMMKFHPKCTICKDVINDIKHKIENSQVEVIFTVKNLSKI